MSFVFQIWRPVTATFVFPVGFQYLVNLYFLYHYSTRLETGGTAAHVVERRHANKSLFSFELFSFLSWWCVHSSGPFDGRPADYVFLLLFNWICIVVSFDPHSGNSTCKNMESPLLQELLAIFNLDDLNLAWQKLLFLFQPSALKKQ